MGLVCNQKLVLLSLLACLTWLGVELAEAEGRVFIQDFRNGSNTDFEAASSTCEAQGARVASAMELRHAVVECSFFACARGWITGPSIGTTVCRSLSGSLRAVDMQVENGTHTYERLAVFCVKDTGAPCGGPPSFPNTHLQRQTGLELGDELLYACNPGYVLPNKETAFSLLCDSCGEWYGIVHLCVKDDAEVPTDYEDKLPEHHQVYDGLEEVHPVSLMPETTSHGQVEETTPESEQTDPVIVQKEQDQSEKYSLLQKSLTEPPVSQLSQKHMFWFPSEAFQEEEHPLISTVTPVKGSIQFENSIATKTDDSQPEPEITAGHYDQDHTTLPPTVSPVSHNEGGTVEAWLDGYPVPQDNEKASAVSTEEPVLGQVMDTETVTDRLKFEDVSLTASPKEAGVEGVFNGYQEKTYEGVSVTEGERDLIIVTDRQEEELKRLTENPEEKGYDKGFHSQGVAFQETTENGKVSEDALNPVEKTYFVTMGPTVDEVEGEGVRREEVEHEKMEDGLPKKVLTDKPNAVELSPTSLIDLHQITAKPDDTTFQKRPIPYTARSAPENVSTSQDGLGFEHTITPSGMAPLDTTTASGVHVISYVVTPTISVSWKTKDIGYFVEPTPNVDDDVSLETYDNQSTMEGITDSSQDQQKTTEDRACTVDPCQMAGRGPTIAAIIVGIVAAIVGVALGIWCYKRRQHKMSHYQLNGTNRQTQSIELQQTV